MGACSAHYPLHLLGRVDQLFDIGLAFVLGGEIGLGFQRLGNGDGLAGDIGDQLGDPVHFTERHIQHAAHIAHRGARLELVESDDGGHHLFAVFLGAIFHHARTLVVLEIQVDVGHADAVDIKEALENETVVERVEQGNVQTVGNNGTFGRAAGVVPDVLFLGVTAQVPDDEEVGVKAHFVDDAELVFEALTDHRILGAIPATAQQPCFAQFAQISCRGVALRYLEFRQVVAGAPQVHLAALGNEQGIGEGFGHLSEQGFHLGHAAQVEIGARHAHAAGLGEQAAGLHAKKNVLQAGVGLVHVVDIVGGHVASLVAVPQFAQGAVHRMQFGDFVVLQLEEKAVRAEDFVIPIQLGFGIGQVLAQDGARHLSGEAARSGDQAFGVGGKEIAVDARKIIKPLQLRRRSDLEQVLVAGHVLGQQKQVRGLLVFLGVAVAHAARG